MGTLAGSENPNETWRKTSKAKGEREIITAPAGRHYDAAVPLCFSYLFGVITTCSSWRRELRIFLTNAPIPDSWEDNFILLPFIFLFFSRNYLPRNRTLAEPLSFSCVTHGRLALFSPVGTFFYVLITALKQLRVTNRSGILKRLKTSGGAPFLSRPLYILNGSL